MRTFTDPKLSGRYPVSEQWSSSGKDFIPGRFSFAPRINLTSNRMNILMKNVSRFQYLMPVHRSCNAGVLLKRFRDYCSNRNYTYHHEEQ